MALGILAVVEATSYLGIAIANRRLVEPIRRRADIYREQTARIARLIAPDPVRLDKLDSLLGWRYAPNHSDPTDQINAQDLRSTRTYLPVPRQGITRVAAFGDSFVYGTEVANAEAWPAVMETMDSGLEVLNYGVGGYGTDQAYLRYRVEGAVLKPSIVIIGFVPDDIRRVVNVYRRFISSGETPVTKPRFVLDGKGQLVLLSNPLPDSAAFARLLDHPAKVREFGKHDYWYEPAIYANPLYDISATTRLFIALWIRLRHRYLDPDRVFRGAMLNASSEAFRIQVVLFQRFAEDVRAAGARPVVALFPNRDALKDAATTGTRVFAELLVQLRALHIEAIDLTEAFLAAGSGDRVERWFKRGGHYSPAGNRVVAQALRHALGSKVR